MSEVTSKSVVFVVIISMINNDNIKLNGKVLKFQNNNTLFKNFCVINLHLGSMTTFMFDAKRLHM